MRRGEVIVAPCAAHGTQAVPGGLIHDWIGAVFIPNATLASLLRVVRDYDRYKEIYKLVVTDSHSLDSGDTDQEFSMVWRRHVLFVNAAMQGHYRPHDVVATTLLQTREAVDTLQVAQRRPVLRDHDGQN